MRKSKIDREIQNHYQLDNETIADEYFDKNKDKVLKDVQNAIEQYDLALIRLTGHRVAQDYIINRMEKNDMNEFIFNNKKWSIVKKFAFKNLKLTDNKTGSI